MTSDNPSFRRPAAVGSQPPTANSGPERTSRPPTPPRAAGHIPSLRNRQEESMVEALDDLALLQEMRATYIPALRKLVEGGAPSEQILKLVESMAAARLASEAALSADFNLAAIKELFDRTKGKAKESKELTHRLEKLPDSDLDALLLTAAVETDDE